ncbi:MAG TPA: hypothetical protein VFI96_05320, partial [Longimicrobiaceae bacterium]|nr:hypothetical protein [Longimicrobiaceae bacterium]
MLAKDWLPSGARGYERGTETTPAEEDGVGGLRDLVREYEAKRFPLDRRLDLHGEGPNAARDRALRFIQSRAHEEPGQELLLVVERGRPPGRSAGPVQTAVEKLLRELEGGLIDWWQPFGPGSVALRVSDEPRLHPLRPDTPPPVEGEGRTPETSGTALLALHHDIPPELLDTAHRAAELRRSRESISVGMMDAVLRRVWIEAQASAMQERVGFREALEWILEEEEARAKEEME